MLQRLFHIDTDEEVIDPDLGEPYRRITGNFHGHSIEVHEDLVKGRACKYHARADGDPMTTNDRMDEGGLVGWLKNLIGG